MRKISQSAALLTFLEGLEFSEAALGADEETQDLVQPFTDMMNEWDGVFKKEREGRRNVIRANAVVAVRNAQLDTKTVRFGASVLAEVGGDRKAPFFRRFFATAPSVFVRQALRKQCETTLNLVIVEIGKLDKKHALRSYLEPLTDLSKAALDALDARNKVTGERTMSANDVNEWKEGVNALLLSTYAELLKIAAEKGYPRSWADTFFPADSAGPDTATDDSASPEAPSGDAPAAGDADKAKNK